jgi:hypothetical protein
LLTLIVIGIAALCVVQIYSSIAPQATSSPPAFTHTYNEAWLFTEKAQPTTTAAVQEFSQQNAILAAVCAVMLVLTFFAQVRQA